MRRPFVFGERTVDSCVQMMMVGHLHTPEHFGTWSKGRFPENISEISLDSTHGHVSVYGHLREAAAQENRVSFAGVSISVAAAHDVL